MSRMQRVKDALASTLNKLHAQVKESHDKGKIPADYSLGFINAMIFCDHHINMREGEPKFYDRTTSIGALPKPVALKPGPYSDMIGADEIFEGLRDAVLLAARNLVEDESKIEAVKKSVENLDGFIKQLEEAKNDQKESAEQPQANAEPQPQAQQDDEAGERIPGETL